jgi:hypothetical protein
MTKIKIECIDGTYRIMNCLGNYTSQMANILAKDVEGMNVRKVEIIK